MGIVGVTGPLLEFHRAGKTRILAVTNPTRLNVAPELPTAAELGIPGLTVTGTIGLLAPAGTPTGIIERIAQATRSAVAEPAYQQLLIDAGIEPTLDLRIPTIPARDSNLKAATIPIEGGQHWPVGTFMGSQRW
jgi:tripartite-type tricarboxylate transporter receptor subunit TctC